MGYATSPATVGVPYWVSLPHLTSHKYDFHNSTVLCSKNHKERKRADWGIILKMLKKSKNRLINWSPGVGFPIDGRFPSSCLAYHSMVNMFFEPDPALRLRLVPIEGKAQDLHNSCCGANMNHSRAHHQGDANCYQPSRARQGFSWMHSCSRDG